MSLCIPSEFAIVAMCEGLERALASRDGLLERPLMCALRTGGSCRALAARTQKGTGCVVNVDT